ncbi:hypothetical protein ACH5RR_011512 [Cinchona calisaya]|uniref:Uncharacterized protein n=1 Tax=Cinchona calisaya TaxID=153742 RepID=A0ABD3A7M2_9GENT
MMGGGNIEVEKEKEEEDEEALSLCDLPIDEDEENQLSRKETPKKPFIDSQEEFNFCSSWGAHATSKESEMCVADEVFFQGQILPLRHSVSSESNLIPKLQSDCRISRSESLDHSCSVGFTSSVSSRSSSINSHRSLSSGCSVLPDLTGGSKHKPSRPKIRNQFQYSHPSPKPQIRSSKIKNGIIANNSNRKSTLWSIFRVGLVKTPEIAIQDLKFRTNSKSFGSRNSTSSINSIEKEQKKINQKFWFDKNGVFFSSCKCTSSNAVTGPNPRRVSENVAQFHAKNEEEKEKVIVRTTTTKQALSRHRTFEWLKQLSLDEAAAAAAVIHDEA